MTPRSNAPAYWGPGWRKRGWPQPLWHWSRLYSAWRKRSRQRISWLSSATRRMASQGKTQDQDRCRYCMYSMVKPLPLTMDRWPGIWPNINSLVIPSTRQSKMWNVVIGTKWSCNSTAQTQDVCGRVYRQLWTTKRKSATSQHQHIQSLPIPVCCPHMLQDGHHCSCTQECKGNWTKWLLPHSTHFCHHEVLWETISRIISPPPYLSP